MLLVGRQEGHPACKNWVVGCWRGCLGWGADLHIAQQMPVPLTISFSSKSRLVLTFLVLPVWYLLTQVVPDISQKSSKTVVCVCVCYDVLKVRKLLCVFSNQYVNVMGYTSERSMQRHTVTMADQRPKGLRPSILSSRHSTCSIHHTSSRCFLCKLIKLFMN